MNLLRASSTALISVSLMIRRTKSLVFRDDFNAWRSTSSPGRGTQRTAASSWSATPG